MTKGELIAKLQALPGDDQTPVFIFDHKKNMHGDHGDGSTEGIYSFEPEICNTDLEADEVTRFKEVHDFEPQPFIALSFDNPELEE